MISKEINPIVYSTDSYDRIAERRIPDVEVEKRVGLVRTNEEKLGLKSVGASAGLLNGRTFHGVPYREEIIVHTFKGGVTPLSANDRNLIIYKSE